MECVGCCIRSGPRLFIYLFGLGLVRGGIDAWMLPRRLLCPTLPRISAWPLPNRSSASQSCPAACTRLYTQERRRELASATRLAAPLCCSLAAANQLGGASREERGRGIDREDTIIALAPGRRGQGSGGDHHHPSAPSPTYVRAALIRARWISAGSLNGSCLLVHVYRNFFIFF